MDPTPHRDFRVHVRRFGREQAPCIVIDNFVAAPEALVDFAATKVFADVASYYPGIRAKVPLTYQHFVVQTLAPVVAEQFGRGTGKLRFTACHFSVVTTTPDRLTYLQRIPHVDSLFPHELAFVHYLFRADFGGTAFFRHRATGFESVDEKRRAEYWRHVEAEQTGPAAPPPAYIVGDTPLYERTAYEDAVYNRLVLYRRNSLHSGAVTPHANFSADPRVGRFSINGFLAT
jgi:hypothetical protein